MGLIQRLINNKYMRSALIKTLIMCVLAICNYTHLQAQVSAVPYKISKISAHLFYNDGAGVRGSLSENIIDNSGFSLWNTIIGEGSAKGSSTQTLVVVHIAANSNASPDRKVVLTVTSASSSKVIFKKAIDFSIYSKGVKSFAFLLNDTGCDALLLKAEIVNSNQKTEAAMSKKIAFECGE